ncbi:hypothetical protein GCM10010174_59460 [Kutzneria viridogrisea]|uniref:Uncharacterized protein n=2 Tax=Kutzneria TaxID=43356 RepID=W5W3R8_9PSEU|nr:hypothetical protein [Kutzneria albida]AHH95430.1 hypothetical protein KALB_2061 [Kutzneria albida DSM 43870]MBA8927211.1 hypothetical protein [Kutzneria viridogrisea]
MSGTALTAARRSAYTGEPAARAGSAMGAGDSHGLDTCSSGQRRLRALFALLLCNQGAGQDHPLDGWELDFSVVDFVTYSPEPHGLVVLTSAPHVLAETCLVQTEQPRRSGLPGLRPLNADQHGRWFRFRHVPTRTLLRIASAEGAGATRPQVPIAWEIASRAWDLHPAEQHMLDVVPPVHRDAEELLAGLLVRLGTNDPDGRWRVGGVAGSGHWTSLWGRGRHWTLTCREAELVAGLTAALCGPEIGMAGTVVLESDATSTLVGHREATLRLIGPTG